MKFLINSVSSQVKVADEEIEFIRDLSPFKRLKARFTLFHIQYLRSVKTHLKAPSISITGWDGYVGVLYRRNNTFSSSPFPKVFDNRK